MLSELCQNKFPLKVSKESMESFCYTLLNSPKKWQASEEALSVCIYSRHRATNTTQKRECGSKINSDEVFRVLLFSPHTGVDSCMEETHDLHNCTLHDVTVGHWDTARYCFSETSRLSSRSLEEAILPRAVGMKSQHSLTCS